jgi:hypothetical protein
MRDTAMRMVVVAAWVGALFALTSWDDTTPALVCAAAATVVTGLLVGRWWLLLVPTVAAVALSAWLLLLARDPDEYWDADPADYVVAVVMVCAIVVALLALGVAARKVVRLGGALRDRPTH